ncbi:MAG: hypothetical protein H0V89_05715 [Deltaproteobacteria bacterium]|nr:hypothetical protein [Deltaproteobacteria bacterium]
MRPSDQEFVKRLAQAIEARHLEANAALASAVHAQEIARLPTLLRPIREAGDDLHRLLRSVVEDCIGPTRPEEISLFGESLTTLGEKYRMPRPSPGPQS